MAPFDSFQRLLKEYMKRTNPKHVLEFGPGMSTRIILSFPVETLLTIEHDKTYYEKALKEFQMDTRVAVIYLPDQERYQTFIKRLDLKFDLIFVDGKDEWRSECMKVAKESLSPTGVLLLHDSERGYAAGRKEFFLIEESQGTAVFCLPKTCPCHGGSCR